MPDKKTKPSNRITVFLKNIGPGFLLAGAAIGVSHVIQSTRAGGAYGFNLIWVLVLGCVSKYPFMEFASRYLAVTGNDLITGYKKYNKLAYWSFFGVTVGTMFSIQAAITMVTAGVAEQIFNLGWSSLSWSILILAVLILTLLIGKYTALDSIMKVIIVTLTLATISTVVLAFSGDNIERVLNTTAPSYQNIPGFLFLIAFMGWMPIPMDASIWHTLWMTENAKVKKVNITLKGALSDFKTGYISASILGLFFLLLGALMLFGTDETFSSDSVQFSAQLIGLYQTVLGNWSGVIMAIAIFITLISTLITVVDIYPRVLARFISESKHIKVKRFTPFSYNVFLILIPIISLFILSNFKKEFTVLVDFAAGLSFVSTALLAFFNYRLVTQKKFPKTQRPGKAYKIFSLCCLALLIIMALAYLIFEFIL